MKLAAPFALALPLVLAACGPLGPFDFRLTDSTEGERGAVTFSTTEGADCIFTCGVQAPLAVGSRDVIVVAPRTPEDGLTVVSSDPRVLSAALEVSSVCCRGLGDRKTCSPLDASTTCSGARESTYRVRAVALSSGSAELRVLHADGSELDRVRIFAADVRTATLEVPEDKPAPAAGLSWKVGTRVDYRVKLLDANGVSLRAPGVQALKSSDASVVSLRGHFASEDERSDRGEQLGRAEAIAAGAARFELLGGSTVSVNVTP